MEAKQRGIEIARRWLAALTEALETGAGQPPKAGIAEADRAQAAGLVNPQISEYALNGAPDAAIWVAAEPDAMARLADGLDEAARGVTYDAGAAEARTAIPEYAASVFAIDLEIEGVKLHLFLGVSDALSEAKAQAGPPTLDLLLDVELPLSVSFGRTYLPVRDILKLSTGSIVELN